jgi:NAD(P)-dependent dehydrogenase (short-subunit alcohol dehydrogenase family)
MADLNGKLALITGATGGIGKAIAAALARQGATVAIVGRSNARVAAARSDILAHDPGAKLEAVVCDLSSQASIREAVAGYLQRHERLDILVNAAGVFRKAREVTADGLEMTFATNVMSYFLLSELLLPALRRAAPSRIVNIGSAYGGAKLDFDDLQTARGKYSFLRSTPPTMLARLLLTRQLAEELAGTGVVVNVVHPGLTKNTELLKDVGGVFALLTNLVGKSADQAADTAIWLASDPATASITGKFWAKRKELPAAGMGSDKAAQQRLWNECHRLAGMAA